MRTVKVLPKTQRPRRLSYWEPLLAKLPTNGDWLECSPEEYHALTGLSSKLTNMRNTASNQRSAVRRLGLTIKFRTLPTVGLRLYIRRNPNEPT
mgnify:CR=1 FL=1